MKLFAAGVSHKTAPVEVREQLAVTQADLVDVARLLKLRGVLDEVALLSTCNRVEIYAVAECSTNQVKSLFRLISDGSSDVDDYIYIHEDDQAVRHLIRVAAGLDSMVLGETEITGQIKNAYEIARTAGLTGRVLNCLFQKAFQTTKEIRTRTRIGRGAVSVKSAAVDLIGRTFGNDFSRPIMVIGAGEMAESCVRSLTKKGARSILISNRSFDRALDLAIRCGGEAVCFGDCLFGMRDVDAVISATSSTEALLNCGDAENLMKARRQRPLLLIDLSVPRNIEADVADLNDVSLYNIDDLEAVTRQGVQSRQGELTACHQIIETHVRGLIDKLQRESERHNDHVVRFTRPHELASSTNVLLKAS